MNARLSASHQLAADATHSDADDELSNDETAVNGPFHFNSASWANYSVARFEEQIVRRFEEC